MVRQAIKISGISSIALTKLDVLDTFDRLKVCTSYKFNEVTTNVFPSDNYNQNKVRPIYEEISGWGETTKGISDFKDLPEKAIGYIKRLETLIECPINIISTGPERKDTIIVKNLFN